MKKKVYLDTTIPSYYYDNRKETAFLIKTTRNWFRTEMAKYEIYVSEATIVEAETGDYPNKGKILSVLKKWKVLPYERALKEIVEVYLNNHLMPKEYGGDALHLAYASYYKMDFLLTWNCKHLANANKKKHIRVMNTKLGLYVPEITTPLELI